MSASVTVNADGLKDAIRVLAVEKATCLADTFVEQAQANAPVDSGALRDSITHGAPADSGGDVTVEVSVGVPYGIYADQGRGAEHGLLAFQVGGEMVVVTDVAPMAGSHFWSDTVEAWSGIVGACAG